MEPINHFIAKPLPGDDGYSWTLPSRLGSMLASAEKNYGLRDRAWTILGVEFGTDDRPQVWFPVPERKNVLVHLGQGAQTNLSRAIYQLAHEVIHLLSPTGKKGAPVIEEGLAVLFSEEWCARDPDATEEMLTSTRAYIEAGQRVRKLLEADAESIKKLRMLGNTSSPLAFKNMTKETFHLAGLDTTDKDIAELLKVFKEDPAPGQRVEVLWHHRDADTWRSGTALAGGRVDLDDPHLFVAEGPFILQPEEICDWRPAKTD